MRLVLADGPHTHNPLDRHETALAQAAFKAHCKHLRGQWGPRRSKLYAGYDNWDLQPTSEKVRWFAVAEAAVLHNIGSSNLDPVDYGFCSRCRRMRPAQKEDE